MEGFSSWSGIESINPYELSEMMENEPENIVVVDVREPWEFRSGTGHLKGAVLIPMNDIPDKLDQFRVLSGKKVALICHSGERSYYACQFLRENSINNVLNVSGGILKWHQSGLDVVFE